MAEKTIGLVAHDEKKDEMVAFALTHKERLSKFNLVGTGTTAGRVAQQSGLAVTTPGFAEIGRAVAGLGLPTLIVQEGGYLCPELGDNLAAVLGAFL